MKPAVIIDVDGTLVDVSGVRHYVLSDPRRKDFERFHLGAMFCPPIIPVVTLARVLHDAGITVLVVTARKARWRRYTQHWLEKHEVPYDFLLTRADGDARRDTEVKADILARITAAGFSPVLAVDDNPAVVALWRSRNIPTVVVPGWA